MLQDDYHQSLINDLLDCGSPYGQRHLTSFVETCGVEFNRDVDSGTSSPVRGNDSIGGFVLKKRNQNARSN